MGLLARLFGTSTVEANTLGLFDLSGGAAAALAAADRTTLEPLFRQVRRSEEQVPRCDLLLLYCTIETDGAIRNSRLGLREIIRDAGAAVVVVATPNAAPCYI